MRSHFEIEEEIIFRLLGLSGSERLVAVTEFATRPQEMTPEGAARYNIMRTVYEYVTYGLNEHLAKIQKIVADIDSSSDDD